MGGSLVVSRECDHGCEDGTHLPCTPDCEPGVCDVPEECGGTCVCDGAFEEFECCDEACTDVSSDNEKGGECGSSCPLGLDCISGVCMGEVIVAFTDAGEHMWTVP